MKSILPFLLLLTLIFASEIYQPSIYAQVINDQINVHTTTRSFKRNEYWSNSNDGTMEPRWLLNWQNGSPYTITGNERFYDTEAYCFWSTHYDTAYHNFTMSTAQNLPFDALQNVIYMAWEDDDAGTLYNGQNTADRTAPCYPLNHEDEINSNRLGTYSFPIREEGDLPGIWRIRKPNQALLSHPPTTLVIPTSITFNTIWRYHYGYDVFNPLDFGELSNGMKTHVNRTQSVPDAVSSINYNHSNAWFGSGAQPSTDVTYKFVVTGSMKRVTISTDDNLTDFDTYLHLFWWPGSGSIRKIASNDDISTSPINRKSSITKDLCPGTYYVIVEGYLNTTGTFKLSVTSNNSPSEALAAGEITSLNAQVCEGQTNPTLNNETAAFVINGDIGDASNPAISYIWQKKVGNNSFENLLEENSSSLSTTGTMGTEDIVFRRQAMYCGVTSGWAYDTIHYLVGSADGGEIALSDGNTIPEGFDPGSFSSVVDATTDPAPAMYEWYSSINNGASFIKIEGATDASYDSGNLDQTTIFKRRASNACGSQYDDSNEIKVTVIPANGAVRGKVVAPALPGQTEVGIENVEVCAIPLDTATIVHLYGKCDTTDMSGSYFIRDLYYGSSSALFKITAQYEDHDIRINNIPTSDSTQEVILSSSTPQIANFVDHTVYSISGNVYQEFTQNATTSTHGLNGVVVKVYAQGDLNTVIGMDTTKHIPGGNNYGDYGIIVPTAGNYTIIAEYIDDDTGAAHTFDPPMRTVNVTQNVMDIDFKDTSTEHLVGYLGASCNRPLGGAVQIRVYQNADIGGFSAFFDVQESFNLTLPAREYLVEVTEDLYIDLSSEYESSRVKDQLGKFSYSTDISFDSDSSLYIYYHPAVIVELEGIPALTSCEAYPFSLLEQGKEYPDFKIKVWEGPKANNCQLDEGEVVISTDGFQKTIPVLNGKVDYLLIGGQPIIQAPHTARLMVLAKDFRSNDSDSKYFDFLVQGEKAIGEKKITVSPQIPFLVLHDPPGDLSYSYMIQDSSYQTTMRSSIKSANEKGTWEYTQLGAAYSLGISAGPISESIDLIGIMSEDESISRTDNTAKITESVIEIKSSTEYMTSNLPDASVIGDAGDMFVGFAMNFLYSDTDKLQFDNANCRVDLNKGIVWSPDSIKTKFALYGYAVESEIVTLREKANQIPDSAGYFLNQAKVWEDMLKDNELTKARVIANAAYQKKGNITFPTGGGTVKYSETSIQSSTSTVEFLVELDTIVNKGGQWEIAGSGESNSKLTRVKVETGRSRDTIRQTEVTIGYALGDDDSVDRFTVDIYEDPRYGTPIFVSRGSETSCPYEKGSVPIDLFELSYDTDYPASATDIPSDQGVAFGFKIRNNGRYSRTYLISNDIRYSTGAKVEIGDGNDNISQITIAPGVSETVQVVVRRETAINSNIYSFPKIRIVVEPECTGQFYDPILTEEIFFSVDFRSTCSTISLVEPFDGAVVNIESNNLLPVEMRDYDITKIDVVTLQYAKAGTGEWLSSGTMVFPVADLPTGETGKRQNWNLNEIMTDGIYEVRLKVVCPLGAIKYSEIRTIIIDRTKPMVFGIPEPVDDIYDQSENDQISIDFVESIVCGVNTSAVIVDLITGDTLQTNTTCQNSRIIVTPSAILANRTPSVYRVILSGYTDSHDNMGDAKSWVFIVGDFNVELATCLPDLEITNNNDNQDAINVSVYKALSIKSNGTIPGYGITSYKAQSEVELDGGFEVTSGGQFEALIEACEDN